MQQQVSFVQKIKQFKDTKHPNQPESADYQQIPRRAEEPAYIKRQSRQQVNNTEKLKAYLRGRGEQ